MISSVPVPTCLGLPGPITWYVCLSAYFVIVLPLVFAIFEFHFLCLALKSPPYIFVTKVVVDISSRSSWMSGLISRLTLLIIKFVRC